MAWHSVFRRSIGSRWFRVNFTKRGVGASIGVPGLRRSWHSNGRRTTSVTIPGTGIGWRNSEIGAPGATVEGSKGVEPSPPGGSVEEALDLVEDIE